MCCMETKMTNIVNTYAKFSIANYKTFHQDSKTLYIMIQTYMVTLLKHSSLPHQAEGITLKNVRQIHIVEHHWSQIRIDQVIGRVNRLHSHSALPEKERTVDVYKYATVFGKNLHIEDTIKNTDNNMTSDQSVIRVRKKRKLSMINC